MRRIETLFDAITIRIKYAIFVMHAAAFTRIVPHSGVIPEALIAQAQSEGDAVAGQEQQVWFARSVGAAAKCFCCIDSLNQWFAALRINLALEISAELCYPL